MKGVATVTGRVLLPSPGEVARQEPSHASDHGGGPGNALTAAFESAAMQWEAVANVAFLYEDQWDADCESSPVRMRVLASINGQSTASIGPAYDDLCLSSMPEVNGFCANGEARAMFLDYADWVDDDAEYSGPTSSENITPALFSQIATHEVGHFLGLDEDDLEARGLD